MKKFIAIAATTLTMCTMFTPASTDNKNDDISSSNSIIQLITSDAAGYSTGTYKVNTSSGINVRSGAGTNNSKVGAATNGTKFNITKVNGDWGYTKSIKCTNGTKSGWVCLTYTKLISADTSVSKYKTGTYKVNTSSGINVRSGAGTNNSKVGAAKNGTTFNVTKINGEWGYTKSIKCTNGTKSGWVCLTYAKSVTTSVSTQSSTTSSNTASFQKSYNYAKSYWNKRNNKYNYYDGNNCANFVSQCLVAGGVPTNSTWKNGTYAFVNCTGLKNYFVNNYSVTYKKKPSASDIKPGDIIYTDGGGHVMFVMKVSGSTIYASANTYNRDCLALKSSSICGVLKTSKLLK